MELYTYIFSTSYFESIPSHDGCGSVLKDGAFYCLKENGCSYYLILKKFAETYYFLEADKKINWHFHNLVLSRHPELEVRPIKKLPLAS
jgi:hypothetical protein